MRISRATKIARLIAVYSKDKDVRDRLFKETKQELVRLNKMYSWISCDFEFMRVTDQQYAKHPENTFARLLDIFLVYKGNKEIDSMYKDNLADIKQMLAEQE